MHTSLNLSFSISTSYALRILFTFLCFLISFWFWLLHWVEVRVLIKRAISLKILRVLYKKCITFFGVCCSKLRGWNGKRPWTSQFPPDPKPLLSSQKSFIFTIQMNRYYWITLIPLILESFYIYTIQWIILYESKNRRFQ